MAECCPIKMIQNQFARDAQWGAAILYKIRWVPISTLMRMSRVARGVEHIIYVTWQDGAHPVCTLPAMGWHWSGHVLCVPYFVVIQDGADPIGGAWLIQYFYSRWRWSYRERMADSVFLFKMALILFGAHGWFNISIQDGADPGFAHGWLDSYERRMYTRAYYF